jgi:hypothetical protein
MSILPKPRKISKQLKGVIYSLNLGIIMTCMVRSTEMLQHASEHLFYEFWMFNSLAQAMTSGVFGQSALNNAILESFTLHARAILDFLYAEKPKPDDVIAEDYFDTPSDWLTLRPEKSELLSGVHKRVGKEVAHLTYARLDITADEKQWQFAQISNDVNTVFSIFLTNVGKEKLGTGLEKQKSQFVR